MHVNDLYFFIMLIEITFVNDFFFSWCGRVSTKKRYDAEPENQRDAAGCHSVDFV